ncbi:MAG: hypothetical protein E4G99_05630 [Anaerolineales bacterium]|nr:MAG: hypothetical protein E4G99_05630 [Anaerolineales bacterium]
MESSKKTNHLAIVSFVSGIIALICIVFTFVLYNSAETARGIINITDGIIIPVRNLCVAVTLLTGILALKEIKKTSGTKKGKILSWFGIVVGAGWILFGLLVGITFLLAEILH